MNFPLLFKFDDVIAGKGFVCRVKAQGRVLLDKEDDGYWMYGVTPGAVAGGGKERSGAFQEFKRGYISVLFDIAAETPDLATFKREATEFFEARNRENERLWLAALHAARRGEPSTLLQDLKVVHVDSLPPKIEISGRSIPRPSINPQHKDVVLVAAEAP